MVLICGSRLAQGRAHGGGGCRRAAWAATKIEIVQADHHGKADIGAGIAREWFERGGVDAITGVPNSAVAFALIDVAVARNKVLLLSAAGSSDISGRACAPANVLEWTFDTFALANSTVRALKAEGAETWFFVTADYALGRSLERDARSVITGVCGKTVGSVSTPVDTADCSSPLISAQASGARVIALANAATDTVDAVKQAHEFQIGQGPAGQGDAARAQRLTALLFDVTDANGIGLETGQELFFTNAFCWDRDEASRA